MLAKFLLFRILYNMFIKLLQTYDFCLLEVAFFEYLEFLFDHAHPYVSTPNIRCAEASTYFLKALLWFDFLTKEFYLLNGNIWNKIIKMSKSVSYPASRMSILYILYIFYIFFYILYILYISYIFQYLKHMKQNY